MRWLRQFHRWIGLGGVVFLLLVLVTGILWAYAPYLYWKDDYKKKKIEIPSPTLAQVRLSAGETLAVAHQKFGNGVVFSSLILRTDFGRLLYEAQGKRNGQESVLILDAITGEVLSPLNESIAVTIARQYVPAEYTFVGTTHEENYVDRNGKKHGNATIVRFQEGGSTEIVISRNSGQILEDQDRIRRFHFWVMRLHMLNFLGFKKTLTIIPGVILLAMIISGLWIWIKYRKARMKQAPT